MARSTCNPNVDVPKGMRRFKVIRSNIKDSLGQYCEPGDMAVLTKPEAQVYLDLNFIKVALPDDFGGEYDNDGSEDDGDDKADSAEGQGDDGDPPNEAGEGETERSTSEDNSGESGSKRESGTSSQRQRGRAARRTRTSKASKAS